MSMSSQKVEEYVTALNLFYALYGLRLGSEENIDGLYEDCFHLVDDKGERETRIKIIFDYESKSFVWKWT